jgi:hypothetical protein
MVMLVVTVSTQQSVHLDQRLSDMADISDLVFSRATLNHMNIRFPMLGQWVLLHIRTYVLEKPDTTSNKVLNLGLERVTVLHIMSGSTEMINTMKLGLIPPLRVGRYSRWVTWSNQLPFN